MYSVVRAPVAYRVAVRETHSVIQGLLAVTLDFYNIYYVLYVVVAIYGGLVNPFWNCILLFDIVAKNHTSRDVLLSVWIPRKQIAATIVLASFTMYTFSFLVFSYFPDHVQDHGCDSLSSCMLIVTSFGLRSSGGIGDYMGMDSTGLQAGRPPAPCTGTQAQHAYTHGACQKRPSPE